MKDLFLILALICLGSSARAAGAAAVLNLPMPSVDRLDLAQAPSGAAASVPTVSGTAQEQPASAGVAPSVTNSPSYLYNIGGGFGPDAKYHVALDYNPMVGACIGRDWTDGKWIGGPCHNGVVGTRNNIPVIVTGFAILYDADHLHPDYQLMAGGNLFGLGAAVANDAMNLGISGPPWLQKAGECAYIYYGLGHRFNSNTDANDVKTAQTVTVMLTYKFGTVPAADAAAQTILRQGL